MKSENSPMPLISVIIPAYNAAKTIERTIRSVMASTIPLDIWVVDDGSTDGTGKILDQLIENQVEVQSGSGQGNRSRLFVLHQANSGAYQARLNALKQIKTPYFGFVDADDTVAPDMFEKMLALAKREQLDVVQVGWKEDGLIGNPRSNNPTIFSSPSDIFSAIVRPIMWEGRDSSFIWDKLYRNQYDFESFDSTDHVTNFDDLIFNLQFFTKVKRMGIIDEPLYHYATTEGSAARKFRWRLVHDYCETLRMRRKMAGVYGVAPWGWLNFRWMVKNARNLFAIWLKSRIKQS